MELQETERIEFKLEVTERICKTIIAFANSTGGDIYVGIDDFGQVHTIDDIDAQMLRISNYVHDLITPELLQFVHIEPFELEGKRIIHVAVESGDEKPYYLASKGLVPAGVFTRLGPATVPMGERAIRRLIRESDLGPFDGRRSIEQQLTFEDAELFFRRRHVPFGTDRYRALGMLAPDGYFSNLALLISDQNPYTIKVAAFSDDAGTEFLTKFEAEGSILRQFDEVLAALRPLNNLRSYFPSHTRIDQYDYPERAVREGVLNAIIHRDYEKSFYLPTLIKMYRTKLAFVSCGDLHEITVAEALGQVSSPRNPRLLALFGRLGEVEAYGSGLPMICELYRSEDLEPTLECEQAFTTLTLPNINTTRNPYLSQTRNDGPSLRGDARAFEELDAMGALPARVKQEFARAQGERAHARRFQRLRAEAEARGMAPADAYRYAQELVDRPLTLAGDAGGAAGDARTLLIEYASTSNAFSREDAQGVLGTGRDTALKVINGLVEDGVLEKTGRARATRYRLVRPAS